MNVVALNPRAVVGNNQPPGCIDTAQRVRGEWFNLTPRLREFIAENVQKTDDNKRIANVGSQEAVNAACF